MKRILLLFLLLFFVSAGCWAAYDGTKPAGTTPVASSPALIRENFRALKDDALVNAGRLASYTPVEVMGELFSCVASTTSTVMLNSSGTNLLLGTATGTHKLLCLTSISEDTTGSANPFGAKYSFSVWVATTTEVLGKICSEKSTTNQNFNMGIATSTTRGEIIFTASGTIGPTWTNRVWRNN